MTVDSLMKAAAEACTCAASDGGTGEIGAATEGFLANGIGEVTALVPGSIVELCAGGFGYIPVVDATNAKNGGHFGVHIVTGTIGAAKASVKLKDMAALVKSVYLGVLTMDGGAGQAAPQLRINGTPVVFRLSDDPAASIVELKVEVVGMGFSDMPIGAALTAVGMGKGLAMARAAGDAALISGGGVPGLAAARVIEVLVAELVGSTPLARLRASKAEMVELISVAPGVEAAAAAAWICGLIERPGLVDAMAVLLATSAASLGGAGSAEAKTLASARAKKNFYRWSALCWMASSTSWRWRRARRWRRRARWACRSRP